MNEVELLEGLLQRYSPTLQEAEAVNFLVAQMSAAGFAARVDEAGNAIKMIPYHDINRIKGAYNIFVSIAGGETLREAQRAFFNGADIAVVWKEFFDSPERSGELAQEFLTSIKKYGRN